MVSVCETIGRGCFIKDYKSAFVLLYGLCIYTLVSVKWKQWYKQYEKNR